jgi:hypothetical protein
MDRRIIFAAALAATALGSSATSVLAADLAVKVRVHHHYRVHALGRPWCVIENTGTAVWTCAPTLAQCHAFEIPGTSLYCVRDPIPGRPYAMR